MDLSYYPGCALHGTSREYDQSLRAVCGALEIRLAELEDWTCCGASSAHMMNDGLARLLAARNLALARRKGRDLLVPCAACYSRLKFAEKALVHDPRAPAGDGVPEVPVRIVHVHDLLAAEDLMDAIRRKTTRPLSGLKVVPYYGCLSVRPPKVVGTEHPENPTALDEVLEALGAQVVRWSFKTDCCGGSLALARPDVVRKLSGDLLAAARHAGGDCLVTDCPMCQANLDTRQREIEEERGMRLALPVFFVTELVGLALGMRADGWLGKHLVDPRPLLAERGLG